MKNLINYLLLLPKKYLGLHAVFVVTALTTVLLLGTTLTLAKSDWQTFITKCANVSLTWLCISLISLFFQTRRFKTYEEISSNPIAVAVFLGLVSCATAIAIAE